MKFAAALILMGGIGACSDRPATIIDGSSPAAFEETTRAARRDLTAADRLIFDRAIATVPARRYANGDPAANARAAFDGLTAADLVATEAARTHGGSR